MCGYSIDCVYDIAWGGVGVFASVSADGSGEPNAYKIEVHQQNYDRLHQEREGLEADSERQCCKAGAQEFEMMEASKNSEIIAAIRDENPPFETPEPFIVRMTPHGIYTSSDSDSETEDDKTHVGLDFPASSILVKHGSKRPEAGADKDSKLAEEEEMTTEGPQKKPIDDANEGGRNLIV